MFHRFVAALLVGTLAACSSSPNIVRVNDSLLTNLDAEAMKPVRDAREARDVARDALALAERKVVEATDAEALAEADLDVAGAHVDRAIAVLKSATNAGSQGTVAKATHDLEVAEAAEIHADDAVSLAEARLALRRAERDLAKAEATLADARVEEAKGMAVRHQEIPEGMAIDHGELSIQVGEFELSVQRAKEVVAKRATAEQKALNAFNISKADLLKVSGD